ncbi:hypothetical protein RvY_00258 [Ramazzottius varieornatus]|uniref:Uncharacterized protein n=1 Tax=Ramazzottius varieornatus TaxID=947166 RepID=A0A1D1UC70_RAMVA|nr:hypothetical protein RvY_00258 [Ramazzottius varieornatus]
MTAKDLQLATRTVRNNQKEAKSRIIKALRYHWGAVQMNNCSGAVVKKELKDRRIECLARRRIQNEVIKAKLEYGLVQAAYQQTDIGEYKGMKYRGQ